MKTLGVLCCLLLTAASVHGATEDAQVALKQPTPTAFLEAHDGRVRAIVLRDSTDSLTADEREQVRLLINEAFYFRELSRQSLGDTWDARTDAEREEFVSVYRGIIERQNLDMFVRYHRDGGIAYTGEQIGEDGRAVVLGEVPVKKEKKIIAYSLHRPDPGKQWQIYDLTVDGAGTVAGNRRAWSRYIARNSYEKLLEGLRKKLAKLEGAG